LHSKRNEHNTLGKVKVKAYIGVFVEGM